MRVEHGIGFPRDCCPLGITNRQRLGALFCGIANSHQSVHRLAGLAHRDNQGGGSNGRVAVSKFMGQLDRGGNARPFFNGVGPQHGGIGGSSTGDKNNAGDLTTLVQERIEIGQSDRALGGNSPTQSVGDSFWFFRNFLSHKTGPTALIRCGGIPINVELCGGGRFTLKGGDGDRIRSNRDYLVLTQRHGLVGVGDECRNIRAQEVLALAQAHH